MRTSSSDFPSQTAARDSAIREALARRQAWNDSGRRFETAQSQPVKVQDPPVKPVAKRVEETSPAILGHISTDAEVQTAKTSSSGETASNEDLIREALRQRGTRYVWGGASRGGFDCSGFVCYIFKTMRGKNLPHSAAAQAHLGTPVKREDLQPGDLVFFSTYRPGISHVGIYIGENKFVHAANTRKDTRIDTLTGYYSKRLRAARRLSPAPIRFTPQQLDQLMKDSSELPEENP